MFPTEGLNHHSTSEDKRRHLIEVCVGRRLIQMGTTTTKRITAAVRRPHTHIWEA